MSLPRVAVTSESKRGGAEKQWSFQQKVACFGRAAEEFSACFLSALRWCVKFLLHDAFNATFFRSCYSDNTYFLYLCHDQYNNSTLSHANMP